MRKHSFLGHVDQAVGPGATAAEFLVTFSILAFVFTVVCLQVFPAHPEWSTAQCVWVLFFAANAGWGTLTATGAFKRWYHHSSGTGISGVDLVICFCDVGTQVVIANWLFLNDPALGGTWWYAIQHDLFLLSAFTLCRMVPFYMRRPMNVASLMAGMMLVTTGCFRVIPGLEWFPCIFLVKNLLHILREEPYRPEPSSLCQDHHQQQQQQQQMHNSQRQHQQ